MNMMTNIDQLVELDRLNMAPVIEQAGGKFDPEFRRKRILVELQNGAAFITVERSGKTVAYVECMPQSDDDWKVMSIQVHPEHRSGVLLRDLLRQAYRRSVGHARSTDGGGRLLCGNLQVLLEGCFRRSVGG